MKPRSPRRQVWSGALRVHAITRLISTELRSVLGLATLALCAALAPAAEAATTNLRPLVTANPAESALSLYASLEAQYGLKAFTGDNNFPHSPDVYTETGKQAAVRAYDMHNLLKSEANVAAVIKDHYQNRRIITIQWHWALAGQSPWRDSRDDAWSQNGAVKNGKTLDGEVLRQVLTSGTDLNKAFATELMAAGDVLEKLRIAGVPVLFRPLHEIDGGWFWWTPPVNMTGADSVKLWDKVFTYLSTTRQLNNLIWVWSAGKNYANTSGNRNFTASFYPGNAQVDIVGVDLYRYSDGVEIPGANSDPAKLAAAHKAHWEMLTSISGGTLPNGQTKKMLALTETAFHHPGAKMADGTLPKWLYVLPWFGGPGSNKVGTKTYTTSVTVETAEMNSDHYLTADELPSAFVAAPSAPFDNFTPTNTRDDVSTNILPAVRITSPLDDALSLYLEDQPPKITVTASDRDGSVAKVDYYALTAGDHDDYATLGTLIGSKTAAPYDFTWLARSPNNPTGWLPGTYTLVAVATDNAGGVTASNPVHITAGVTDAAYDKIASAKSNASSAAKAVNLRYFSVDGIQADGWTAAVAEDSHWFYVDLGATFTVSQAVSVWGRKADPAGFTIQVALANPGLETSWTDVLSVAATPRYALFKQTIRHSFPPTAARYVRILCNKRAENWPQYDLLSFEVPVPGVNPTADISSQPQFSQCQPENASLPVSSSTTVALRFDLSAYPSTVSSAKLRVYKNAGSAATTFTVYPASTDNFSEDAGSAYPALGTAIQSQALTSAAQWVEFDVTAAVAAQLAAGGDKVASFVIKGSTTSWGAYISTRNAGANLPQLLVSP